MLFILLITYLHFKKLNPFEKLYNNSPNLSMFHVLGCLCYANTLFGNIRNLTQELILVFFLDSNTTLKDTWFIIYTHDIFISRDVIFHEKHFPPITTNTNQNLGDHSTRPSNNEDIFKLNDSSQCKMEVIILLLTFLSILTLKDILIILKIEIIFILLDNLLL